MNNQNDSESLRTYRNLVMIYATNLWQEKNTENRANIAMYLAEAATTLARLETEEARTLRQVSLAKGSENL
ncbi:MAG: hypothetical protein AB4426_17950 [Xenococcaceae cyanobacterium]